MKAIVLERPALVDRAPLTMRDLPTPEPGQGQVRLRVLCCGVCHTDLHLIEGELVPPRYPLVPGHQIVGVVEACGPGVDSELLGQRLGVPWLASTCGACTACRSGRENLCEDAKFNGFDRPGGFAEKVVVEAAFSVAVPATFADAISAAPLLCGGVIGYRALRLCGVATGGRLGLFGFGGSAHIVIQLARARDMEVYVFTRSRRAQALAQRLGAAWIGGPDDTPRVLLDGAISFTPKGASLRTALERVGRGGIVAGAGIYTDPIPELDYGRHLYHEKALRSVANATREDAAGLMAAAAAAGVRTEVESFALDQANQALQALKHGTLKGGAAVLRVGA